MNIKNLLPNQILILDGAMGTMIQTYKLKEEDYKGSRFLEHTMQLKGNNDLLTLTKPEIIAQIHEAYLKAGAHLITTNTFNSNRISLADYRLQHLAYELNFEGAKLAKTLTQQYSTPDYPRFTVGAIGPTSKTLSMSQNVNNPASRELTFDEMVDNYKEAASGLIDGGADILMIETIFDTLNAKAAGVAILEVFDEKKVTLPIMISGTITDAAGRTLSGQTPQAFLNSLAHLKPLSIGLNCALGARQLKAYIKELADNAPFYISAHPNAGLPNAFGQYDESPQAMLEVLTEFATEGLINIVGGCCGTTPAHIKLLANTMTQHKPRTIPNIKNALNLSGLEALKITRESLFVNVGERTNVTGSAKFLRLIREKKLDEALEVAREQVENGANIIDINMDEAMLDSKQEMVDFLNLVASEPDIAKVPIMVDSSKFEVIEAGLKCIQGKSIVNSISLKNGEEEFIKYAKIIQKLGAAIVVMAFDEKGQADTLSRKQEICSRAYHLLMNIDFNPADIIFDPNVFAIATGLEEHNNYAKDFIEACRFIRDNLPDAFSSGGISNVSFSFRGNNKIREAIHCVFLYHAIANGLNMGIVNASQMEVYDQIEPNLRKIIEDVVLNRDANATETLITLAEGFKNVSTEQSQKEEQWREFNLQERLAHSLVKGIDKYLEVDLTEALKIYPKPVDIIEQPLMAGMNQVGELFANGKMFLPQVVKTARVMKKMVAFLTPYIEANKEASYKGTILLATVKGDVHDIGKNIVGVVLACNGYNIIDLGVMTPLEKIIDTIKNNKIDIVGLSGLITPSLEEMTFIADEFLKQGIDLPIMIGGATTSRAHTAYKIAANNKQVVYVADASKAAVVASQLMNNRQEFFEQLNQEYAVISDRIHNKQISLLDYHTANAFQYEIDSKICLPTFLGAKEIHLDMETLTTFIDWQPFFSLWNLKGKWPEILHNQVAHDLFQDTIYLLDKMIHQYNIQIKAKIGFYKAIKQGNDIYLPEVGTTFYHLRNQGENAQNLCLADFINNEDYIGIFALCVDVEDLVKQFDIDNDEYKSILTKAIADRIAEGGAEYLHLQVRKELWAYAPNENLTHKEIFQEKYQGIRPAAGYPTSPDHSEKTTLFKLLDFPAIELTETFSMLPASAVCGFYFNNQASKYFNVGKISEEQLQDYANRKKIDLDLARKNLAHNLI